MTLLLKGRTTHLRRSLLMRRTVTERAMRQMTMMMTRMTKRTIRMMSIFRI